MPRTDGTHVRTTTARRARTTACTTAVRRAGAVARRPVGRCDCAVAGPPGRWLIRDRRPGRGHRRGGGARLGYARADGGRFDLELADRLWPRSRAISRGAGRGSGHLGRGRRARSTDADALVCLLLDRIDAAVLARAPRLRVVANCRGRLRQRRRRGGDRARGSRSTNTPDVLTEATAELAFALMLAAARRLPEGERLVRGRRAGPGWRLDQLLGVQLVGRTLGIVGLGRIGAGGGAGARRLRDGRASERRPRRRRPAAGDAAPARVALDELFARADVVSLHCPLTPETRAPRRRRARSRG